MLEMLKEIGLTKLTCFEDKVIYYLGLDLYWYHINRSEDDDDDDDDDDSDNGNNKWSK